MMNSAFPMQQNFQQYDNFGSSMSMPTESVLKMTATPSSGQKERNVCLTTKMDQLTQRWSVDRESLQAVQESFDSMSVQNNDDSNHHHRPDRATGSATSTISNSVSAISTVPSEDDTLSTREEAASPRRKSGATEKSPAALKTPTGSAASPPRRQQQQSVFDRLHNRAKVQQLRLITRRGGLTASPPSPLHDRKRTHESSLERRLNYAPPRNVRPKLHHSPSTPSPARNKTTTTSTSKKDSVFDRLYRNEPRKTFKQEQVDQKELSRRMQAVTFLSDTTPGFSIGGSATGNGRQTPHRSRAGFGWSGTKPRAAAVTPPRPSSRIPRPKYSAAAGKNSKGG